MITETLFDNLEAMPRPAKAWIGCPGFNGWLRGLTFEQLMMFLDM